jgi:hypothetical protein
MAVRKALDAKRIFTEPDGEIDFAKADAAWASNTDTLADHARPSAATHTEIPPGGDTGSYIDARTRRERALAEEAELDLAKRKGELLSSADVKRDFAVIAKIYSSGRKAIPTTLAPMLVGKTDPVEIERLIREQLKITDARIADEIKSRTSGIA